MSVLGIAKSDSLIQEIIHQHIPVGVFERETAVLVLPQEDKTNAFDITKIASNISRLATKYNLVTVRAGELSDITAVMQKQRIVDHLIICGHGTPDSIYLGKNGIIDQHVLETDFPNLSKKPGTKIILLSCSTGKKLDGIAAHFIKLFPSATCAAPKDVSSNQSSWVYTTSEGPKLLDVNLEDWENQTVIFKNIPDRGVVRGESNILKDFEELYTIANQAQDPGLCLSLLRALPKDDPRREKVANAKGSTGVIGSFLKSFLEKMKTTNPEKVRKNMKRLIDPYRATKPSESERDTFLCLMNGYLDPSKSSKEDYWAWFEVEGYENSILSMDYKKEIAHSILAKLFSPPSSWPRMPRTNRIKSKDLFNLAQQVQKKYTGVSSEKPVDYLKALDEDDSTIHDHKKNILPRRKLVQKSFELGIYNACN